MQKKNPKQWLPLPGIADAECTLLEFWSRYHNRIAVFCGFDPQKTVEKYTTALYNIKEALSKLKMLHATAYDIWDAVVSVRYKHNGMPYSDSELNTRLVVIKDMYKVAESMAICCNPIWLPPWQLINAHNYDYSTDDIKAELRQVAAKREKKLPRGLTKRQEQKLMHMIMEHITEDGRWVALLLMLWCGFRPSEVRGLNYGHLLKFTAHPSRRYITAVQTATSSGEVKDTMKNKYSVRSVPEHIELKAVMMVRSNYVQGQLPDKDLPALPLACFDGDFDRRCTATELSLFAKTQLKQLFSNEESLEFAALELFLDELNDDSEYSAANTASAEDRNADMEISARMLRRNYATKCYAETRMTDVQIRLTMGHKIDTVIDDPYSESSLWLILQNMDHRMIIPEMHRGWGMSIVKGKSREILDLSQLYISIPKEVLAEGVEINITALANEIGDDMLLKLQRLLPDGSEITVKTTHLLDPHRHVDRINTDMAHWPIPRYLEYNYDGIVDNTADAGEDSDD